MNSFEAATIKVLSLPASMNSMLRRFLSGNVRSSTSRVWELLKISESLAACSIVTAISLLSEVGNPAADTCFHQSRCGCAEHPDWANEKWGELSC